MNRTGKLFRHGPTLADAGEECALLMDVPD